MKGAIDATEKSLDARRWNGLPVDTSAHGTIKLLNAGLDTSRGDIIAHGWLDLESINLLRVEDYQREVLQSASGKRGIRGAVEDGAILPDILVGMRGQRISFPKGSSECILQDPVYIIDGLQRVFALKTFAEHHPDRAKEIRIGAEVRFATTREIEKELFSVVNTKRTPVSPNVILRNMRENHLSIMTLYGLSHTDKNFALYERICWNQRMARQELLTAMILARAARSLHHSVTSGGESRTDRMAAILDGCAKKIGLNTFRRNIVEFFDVVDVCWGIRVVEYNQSAAQLRGNFLITLASIMCNHQNFWKGNLLQVDTAIKRKLAAFPVLDPEIARLCGAGNAATPLLRGIIIEHLNKGKRVNRLVKRRQEDE